MRHTRLEDSEVFNAFADIAVKEGLLEKKAEFLYPNYDISQNNPELDIKIAGDKRTELYDVTGEKGEDLIQAAHPGGGVVADASGSHDYGKVETIFEQQKANRGVAESMPTGKLAALVERLVSLANELDNAGFEVLAQDLDGAVEKLAMDPLRLKQLEKQKSHQPGSMVEIPEPKPTLPQPATMPAAVKTPVKDPKLEEYLRKKQQAMRG